MVSVELITQCRALLAKIRERRELATKGRWVWDSRKPMRDKFYSDDGTGSIIGTCGEFRYAPRPISEVEANARHMAFLHNSQEAELELVEGFIEVYEYYVGPEACGDFRCDCGTCGLCEMGRTATERLQRWYDDKEKVFEEVYGE